MISPISLCEALEKFGVLAMPASSTRCSLILFLVAMLYFFVILHSAFSFWKS